MRVGGIVLILLGFLGLAFGGVPYNTTENVAQLGDIKFQAHEKKKLEVPPLVSGVVILAGAGMLFFSRKGRPD